jgi:acyl transferase domain-containing protein/3-hydroxymyristoyl/3-hydroxydecanoyl-(acyl carrier protein) dehydratase
MTDSLDRRRVGVILGNIALPTAAVSQWSRDLIERGTSDVHPLNRHATGLPAGLLAKSLGLGGGSLALDAACASSLYALKLACDELHAGRADAMIAGGLNRADSLYTQMGFSQLRALSPTGRCSPLDARADGLLVGEGGAAFVLKRIADAERDGDHIYGVITGIGLSNDIGGGLLAPASEGQLRAMRAAYAAAGWRPGDVDLIECHATGTPVGDGVELASLRELWQDEPGEQGRCVLGAVKSTVGHLLTGAGAAGMLKVLLALKHDKLPPTANFETPPPGADLERGPFRVLRESQRWRRRADEGPRRAAVNAFGFGGINAHVLVEEYLPRRAGLRERPVDSQTLERLSLHGALTQLRSPIAVVGVGAHFGTWADVATFRERVLGYDTTAAPKPRLHGGPTAGYFIGELRLPLDRFRTPPAELRETLPQQLLLLQVADEALRSLTLPARPERTGAFVGINLDLNATNFHVRWASPAEVRDEVGPPLTANRVMGSLGSVAASRAARAFGLGGPCFTLSSEESSGARAIELAVRALERGELDCALVGAVDLAGDPRALAIAPDEITPGEGAAAVVLMRLDDAEKVGHHVYAVIDDVITTSELLPARSASEGRVTFDATPDVGRAGAASAIASFVKACLALDQRIRPTPCGPQVWLIDAADGPRLATVVSESIDRNRVTIRLREPASRGPERPQLESSQELRSLTLPARVSEAVFLLDGDTPADLLAGLARLRMSIGDQAAAAGARRWWREHRPSPARRLGLALVARNGDDLRAQLDFVERCLRESPDQPTAPLERTGPVPSLRDRIFYNPRPLRPIGHVAFVYPGSGNHYPGMGRELSAAFPAALARQVAENRTLHRQFAPESFWDGDRSTPIDPRAAIFGPVCVGAMVSDLLALFGVKPAAAIGYSLGESAALFGLRAWRDRDLMDQRLRGSRLFATDLAGPNDAARAVWGLTAGEPAEWLSGVVQHPADVVRQALPHFPRTYLLIVNTPSECVIGGHRPAVDALAEHLGGRFHAVRDVTIAHCDIVRRVERAYYEMHLLPVTPPEGVRYYSGALGRAYDLSTESAAAAIVGHALATIDFPRLIETAYADGVRLFVEVGPGTSCSRMIDAILGERPHLARSACAAREGEVSTYLRLLGALHAERVAVDLDLLYGGESADRVEPRREMVLAVGEGFPSPTGPRSHEGRGGEKQSAGATRQASAFLPSSPFMGEGGRGGEGIAAHVAARVALTQAHETFLRFTAGTYDGMARTLAVQNTLMEWLARTGAPLEDSGRGVTATPPPPRSLLTLFLDRPQCLAAATGPIGPILGRAYAPIDAFPTRVRLPDEPLMLVDRIVEIEGEPLSLTNGRIVTEHDVSVDRWYLDNGVAPPSIAIESGQADLFLSGFLGIDFKTRGLAMYRLLDASVTFHRGLPRSGETVRYDIRIERFFRQGETYLFRFNFDGTVNGEPLLSMRDGCAGFFTPAELAAGKGVVNTELQRRPQPGKLPAGWRPPVPVAVESYSEEQLDSLRAGGLAACFGQQFGVRLCDPLTLPSGRMRLIHRVTRLDPAGGRFGIGLIRSEMDINPDDWFLACHFIDDQVMPGTLMYECCLHTLRVFLLRLGWVGEKAECRFEPVPGGASRLRCRGQVTATTKTVAYEVEVKELGYGPEPFAIADVTMFADGKPIVDVQDMTLRVAGLTEKKVNDLWGHLVTPRRESSSGALERLSAPLAALGSRRHEHKKCIFTRQQVLEFATGSPSAAFGDRYRPFDRDRFIARLPAPPYSFLDRVLHTTAEPWTMKAGGSTTAEYDVPPDAWYFAAARQPAMPYAVLLEVALQTCGWTSAYVGSALHSPTDLHYRNLGGTATVMGTVGPDAGTLTTTVTLTRVSKSAGMIIQNFDVVVRNAAGRDLFRGNTYFGFFAAEALRQQVGIREAQPYQPTGDEQARGERFVYPDAAPFPERTLQMIDRIDLYIPDGGPHGLGYVRGVKDVDPVEWFFKAHFHQDPVWPGSLGLEAFLQLLAVVAARRWGDGSGTVWQSPAVGGSHNWVYRGQVIPGDRQVTVEAVVTRIDLDAQTLWADGFLLVDGRIIYQMKDFAFKHTAERHAVLPSFR